MIRQRYGAAPALYKESRRQRQMRIRGRFYLGASDVQGGPDFLKPGDPTTIRRCSDAIHRTLAPVIVQHTSEFYLGASDVQVLKPGDPATKRRCTDAIRRTLAPVPFSA